MKIKKEGEADAVKSADNPKASLISAFSAEGEGEPGIDNAGNVTDVEGKKPENVSELDNQDAALQKSDVAESSPKGTEEGTDNNGGGDDREEDKEVEALSRKNKYEKEAYGLHKRISTLTARNKAAQEEISSLKRQIAELEKASTTAAGNTKPIDEIDGLEDESALEKYADSIRKERAAAIRLLKSSDDEFDLGGETYSRDQIAGYLDELNAILDKRLPSRASAIKSKADFDAKRAAAQSEAESSFDWFGDENSVGRQWVDKQLNDPDLSANLPMLLSYAFEGLGITKLRKQFSDKKAQRGVGQHNPTTVPSVGTERKQLTFRRADGSFDQDLAEQHLFDE